MALARRRREFINRFNQAGGKHWYNCRNCSVQRRIWNCSHWAISSRLNRSIAIFIGLSVGSHRKRIMTSVTVRSGCKRNRRRKKEEIYLKTSSLISKQRRGSLASHSVLNLRISCCRYLLLSTTKIGEVWSARYDGSCWSSSDKKELYSIARRKRPILKNQSDNSNTSSNSTLSSTHMWDP